MADANNPIRLIYDGYWNCLGSKDDFLEFFPTGTLRQVRYNSTNDDAPDPDLEDLSPADYPRCRVTIARIEPAVHINSNHSGMRITLRTEVCTGQQMQGKLMDCLWSIYRGMTTWETYLRDAVTWNDKPIVVELVAGKITVTDDDKERNRGTEQWIGVCDVEIVLALPTNLLEAE